MAPSYYCAEIQRDDGEIVCLQIWDTAGQERYHAVGKLFYRDSDVALVCYDPSSNPNLDIVKVWVERVREEVPNVNIILILTKSDLLSEENLNDFKTRGENICEQLSGRAHFVTSSIKNIGVKEVFLKCANVVDISFYTTSNQQIPKEKEEKKGCC